MAQARTRFAPSPTGYLHVGGVRTALFAWLVARQSKDGKFLLRIEDTDKVREVAGADKHIIESLQALGLDFDGEPYYQSQHLDVYKQWAHKLVDAGHAYADPRSPDELQGLREQDAKARRPFLIRNHPLAKEVTWDGTQPLRFRTQPRRDLPWHDAIMGDAVAHESNQDDFILMKSDGYPTYNFAHIIDDHEMGVTHVIRGQEFLASIPNYLNLYDALGFTWPVFAEVPHILGPDGKKKLSKRDGARDVLDYIRDGYLPDALISFIATLGWNDGTTQETFSREELLQKFSLGRVGRSGAHFDERRLDWVNGHFIRQLSIDDLSEKAAPFWPAEAKAATDEYKKQVLGLVQERLKYLAELPELTRFFFVDLPVDPALISGHKQLKKLSKAELKTLLEQAQASLQASDFSLDDLTGRLNKLLQATQQKPAVLFSLVRIATTQAPASPALAETLAVLGKDRSLQRLGQQLSALS